MSLQESGTFVNKKWPRSAYGRQDRLFGYDPFSDNNRLGTSDIDHRGPNAFFQRPGIEHQIQLFDQHGIQFIDVMTPPLPGQVGLGR